MKLTNKQAKYINYIILGLQLIGLVLAIDLGGWFAILYILTNLLWGAWWCFKNFELIDTTSDFILGQIKGKAYYKGKEIKAKKNKKKD